MVGLRKESEVRSSQLGYESGDLFSNQDIGSRNAE